MEKRSLIKEKLRSFGVIDWLLVAMLLAAMVTTVIVTFHTSLHMLDSDASSELVLANHLNENGKIISTGWYYGSELRFFNIHLVFAPLFSIFSTWRHVRFFGALILQGMYLLSYWYVCKTAKLNRRAYFLGGALLLLPLSVAYGRIILYNSHYIMNSMVSFLLVGLFLALLRDIQEKRSKFGFAVHLTIWLGLSFISGIGGIRQVCITHLPMMMVLAVVLIKSSQKNDPEPKHFWICVGMMAFCCIAFFAGLLVNKKLLQVQSFIDYAGGSRIQHKALDIIKDIVFAYLHMFGYRRGVLLLSTAGILALLGLLVAGIITVYSLWMLVGKEYEQSFYARFLILLFPCSMIAYALMLLTVSSVGFPALYINSFFPLFFLAVGAVVTYPIPEKRNRYGSPRRILSGFVAVVMLANTAFNVLYFINPKKYLQDYEGLAWWDIHTVSELEPLRAYLVDNGYDVGYCSYWFSNILTEMSSGQLLAVPIIVDEEGIRFQRMLSVADRVDLKPQKPFLIIERRELPDFEKTEIYEHCRLLVEEVDYFAYELDDPMVMYQYLHQD